MRGKIAGVLAGLAITGVACGGGDDKDTAEAALRRQFDQISKGQWGRQWDELHPAQQAIMPKDKFVECGSKAGSIDVSNIKVLEQFEEEVTIPGTDQRAKSTALTVEYEISAGSQRQKDKDTFHEYLVDGKWRWGSADPTAAVAC